MSNSIIRDPDLKFLANMSNEEIDPLLDVLLGKDRKGRISSEIDLLPVYQKFAPDHSKYIPEIVHEFKKYGGSTIANMIRGGNGVPYKEILCDVCKRLKVNFNKKQSVVMIEGELLSKVLADVWEKMPDKDREAAMKDAGIKVHSVGGVSATTLIMAFKAGGFKSYQLTLIIINYVWKLIFGKGLTLAINSSISKVLAMLTGPVGWITTIAWTAFDIASPAYRVTIPGVIYIAGLRRLMQLKDGK